jgi:hypothetical protein
LDLRDTLNTEENYKDCLISNREALLYFQEKLRKLQSDLENGIENYKKPTIEVYKSTLATILSYQRDILLATYSIGDSLSAFKEEYIIYVSSLIPIWRKEWGYEQMLWALSIGILLNIDEETFDQLVALVKKDDPEDYLIDYLIQSRHPEWTIRINYNFPRPYGFTRKIIEEENSEKAVSLLKEYLTKKWYQGCRDEGWYDLHKYNIDNYYGYWSFESGALCKIKGLDYKQLEGLPYFPYDLVAAGKTEE